MARTEQRQKDECLKRWTLRVPGSRLYFDVGVWPTRAAMYRAERAHAKECRGPRTGKGWAGLCHGHVGRVRGTRRIARDIGRVYFFATDPKLLETIPHEMTHAALWAIKGKVTAALVEQQCAPKQLEQILASLYDNLSTRAEEQICDIQGKFTAECLAQCREWWAP